MTSGLRDWAVAAAMEQRRLDEIEASKPPKPPPLDPGVEAAKEKLRGQIMDWFSSIGISHPPPVEIGGRRDDNHIDCTGQFSLDGHEFWAEVPNAAGELVVKMKTGYDKGFDGRWRWVWQVAGTVAEMGEAILASERLHLQAEIWESERLRQEEGRRLAAEMAESERLHREKEAQEALALMKKRRSRRQQRKIWEAEDESIRFL